MKIIKTFYTSARTHPVLFSVTFFVVITTLFFGLKPKGYRFINQVRQTGEGLSFYNIGIVYSEKTLGELGCTTAFFISGNVKPLQSNKTLSHLTSIIDENNCKVLTIDQWMEELEVSLWNKNGTKILCKSVDSILLKNTECTIAAGIHNGTLWIFNTNTRTMHFSRKKHLTDLSKCRIVFGIGPAGKHPWKGTVNHIAIGALSPDTQKIIPQLSPFFQKTERKDSIPFTKPALFNFRLANKGTVISAVNNVTWPLKKPVLMRFFKYNFPEIIPDLPSNLKGFIADLFINFIGFLPIGFISCLFLSAQLTCSRHAAIITVFFTLTISILIESAQIFIPTRTSQLIDILLNTSGGLTGSLLGFYFRRF